MKRLFIGVLSVLVLLACDERWHSITADQVTTRTKFIEKTIKDRCAQLGQHPWVTFTYDRYVLMFEGESVTAAMWTSVGNNEIHVWMEVAENEDKYPDWIIDAYARHECCHLHLGHRNETKEVEQEAEKCAREQYGYEDQADGGVSTCAAVSWVR